MKGYDYSAVGAYFVTICSWNKRFLFGNILSGEMILNETGEVAHKCWKGIPQHFPHVMIDEYIIMPNHVHGILVIKGGIVGAKNFSPSKIGAPRGTSKTIGSVIRGFKIGVTKWARQNTSVEHVWQRNYYEHVIRNEEELNLVRKYIINNPKCWEMDRENPEIKDTPTDIKTYDFVEFGF